MDSFEVMESPAVRAALAGRQQQQQPGTAGSSPAGSLTSPGYVSGGYMKVWGWEWNGAMARTAIEAVAG